MAAAIRIVFMTGLEHTTVHAIQATRQWARPAQPSTTALPATAAAIRIVSIQDQGQAHAAAIPATRLWARPAPPLITAL